VAPAEVAHVVEGLLVGVDLAEVHHEVEVDLAIAAGLEIVVGIGAVDLFQVAGEDQEGASAREEAALEEGGKNLFCLLAFLGVRRLRNYSKPTIARSSKHESYEGVACNIAPDTLCCYHFLS
jgi:hypothetical protein